MSDADLPGGVNREEGLGQEQQFRDNEREGKEKTPPPTLGEVRRVLSDALLDEGEGKTSLTGLGDRERRLTDPSSRTTVLVTTVNHDIPVLADRESAIRAALETGNALLTVIGGSVDTHVFDTNSQELDQHFRTLARVANVSGQGLVALRVVRSSPTRVDYTQSLELQAAVGALTSPGPDVASGLGNTAIEGVAATEPEPPSSQP